MAKSFLKKTNERETGDRDALEAEKSKPIFNEKHKVVFVNGAKFRRAESILALIMGTQPALKAEDVERKEHYRRQLEKHGIDLKTEDALPALYEILGGLIRTPEEQTAADKAKIEAQKKGKRRMIE